MSRATKESGVARCTRSFSHAKRLCRPYLLGGNPSLSLENPRTADTCNEGATSAGYVAGRLPAAVAARRRTTPNCLYPTPQPTPATQSADTLTLTLAATPPPVPAGRTMSLTEVANALENHPDARPYHKLLALELRARQDPALADQYVADAVQRLETRRAWHKFTREPPNLPMKRSSPWLGGSTRSAGLQKH